jgi:hypothetical protein
MANTHDYTARIAWTGASGYRAIRPKWYLLDAPTAKERVWFSRERHKLHGGQHAITVTGQSNRHRRAVRFVGSCDGTVKMAEEADETISRRAAEFLAVLSRCCRDIDSRISLKRGNPAPLPRSLDAPVLCVYWTLESEPIFPLA